MGHLRSGSIADVSITKRVSSPVFPPQLDLERSNASLRTVQRNYDSISQKLVATQRDLKTSQQDALQQADRAKEATEKAEAAEAVIAEAKAECKSAVAKVEAYAVYSSLAAPWVLSSPLWPLFTVFPGRL